MNTRLSVVLPGLSAEAGSSLAAVVTEQVAADEQMMSRYAPRAELACANRTAAQRPVALSDALFAILSSCREHWVRTGGAFDITLGAINDRRRGASGADEIGGWDHVELDPRLRSLSFAAEGIQLDLGGIGKGIALSRIERLLRERSIEHAFVSFGDSSILTIGMQPGGVRWPVGIRDRFDPDLSLYAFELADGSVSTSGIDPDAPHVVDPARHAAPAGRRTLSVACACPIDAEVLSTALIVRGAAARPAILANYPAAQAIEFAWPDPARKSAAEKVWSHAV